MKVLFVNLIKSEFPSFNLAKLYSIAKKHKIRTKLVENFEEAKAEIDKFNPDIIWCDNANNNIDSFNRLCRYSRKKTFVLSGVTNWKDLSKNVYIANQNITQTFSKIIQSKALDINTVNGTRVLISEKDINVIPDYDNVDLSRYKGLPIKFKNIPDIIKELKSHCKKYSIHDFHIDHIRQYVVVNTFKDASFIDKLCNVLLKNKFKSIYIVKIGENGNFNYKLLQKMRFTGFFCLRFHIRQFPPGTARVIRDAKNSGMITGIIVHLSEDTDLDNMIAMIENNSLYIDELVDIKIDNKNNKTPFFKDKIVQTCDKNNIIYSVELIK